MRYLDLRGAATGRERGLLHGTRFAGEISALAELRIYLAGKISGFSRNALLEVADKHIVVLREFDSELCEELLGMAEGAGLPASHLVVLNQYTDLRDLQPQKGSLGEGDFDGGCTMLWSRGQGRPIFAQTWDMHASAIPYVMMLRVPDAAGGDAYVLSLTGCLGMAGLNGAGLCVGINNLTSTDARIGVVWSAIVRRVLRESSAEQARQVLEGCRFGSGHHYLLADTKEVFSVESSGTKWRTVFRGETASYVHSNHCLDSEIAACSRVPQGSTSYDRHEAMVAELARKPIADVEDAFVRLGSHEGYPRSICTNMSTPENPHAAATCGGIAIDSVGRRVLAVAGFTHNVEPEVFEFTSSASPAGAKN